mgnify:CR=1 FL=1
MAPRQIYPPAQRQIYPAYYWWWLMNMAKPESEESTINMIGVEEVLKDKRSDKNCLKARSPFVYFEGASLQNIILIFSIIFVLTFPSFSSGYTSFTFPSF